MAKYETNYNIKDQHEKEEISYAKVLFLQIDRIVKAITEHNPNCIIGVDALETVLTHHHDEDYFKELEEINNMYKEQLRKAEVLGRVSSDAALQIDFIKAKRKFRALMKLMNRVGLFPKKMASFYD